MKNIAVLLLLFMVCNSAFAGSINPAVYKTMSGQSYSQNYRLNTQARPVPYWQTQANPATRNNYSYMNNQTLRFNQDMSQYEYNKKLMRGY